jgi:hypothetical protein
MSKAAKESGKNKNRDQTCRENTGDKGFVNHAKQPGGASSFKSHREDPQRRGSVGMAADGTAKRDSQKGQLHWSDPSSCKIALRKSKGSVGGQMRQAGAMATRRWSLGTGTYLSRGD